MSKVNPDRRSVMLLAFPLGFFIKGKNLKPFLILGSVGVPIVAILVVLTIQNGASNFLPALFIFWGVLYSCFQVSVLPYIMRNTLKENQSHAISLSFATNSFGMIFSGILIFLFDNLTSIDSGQVLIIISILGFFGLRFLYALGTDNTIQIHSKKKVLQISTLYTKLDLPQLWVVVKSGH